MYNLCKLLNKKLTFFGQQNKWVREIQMQKKITIKKKRVKNREMRFIPENTAKSL